MGRTPTKAFDTVETFEDLSNMLFQMILDYPQTNYLNEETLHEAVLSHATMTDAQKKYFQKFVRQVDRKLSIAGAAHANVFHKLPTILAGSVYIANYGDSIKNLTIDELIALSRFSIVEPPSFYGIAVEYLGKDLLTAVTQKHFDYMYQSAFLDYAESKIRAGLTKEEAAEYIRETPIESLKAEVFEYERKLIEEAGKYL